MRSTNAPEQPPCRRKLAATLPKFIVFFRPARLTLVAARGISRAPPVVATKCRGLDAENTPGVRMVAEHPVVGPQSTSLSASSDVLRALAEGTSAATGDEFFRSLARHAAAALGARYAFVAESL